MRKILVLLFLLISVVTFGQGEIIKVGQKALKRNAKILKAHYPWEYTEPADWINIHYCPKDEILLVASDDGDRYTSFTCTVQSSGQYTVEVYGGSNGDSLINTQTLNTNITWEYQFPLGKGKPCSLGYTTYKIRAYPALSTKKILTWKVSKHTSTTSTLNKFLLANFNAPTLTTFQFYIGTSKCKSLKYACLWNCTGLTLMQFSFLECNAMTNVTLPKTLDLLTDIRAAFYKCSSLVSVKFPKNMDNLTTTYSSTGTTGSLFGNCDLLKRVEFPRSMNSLIGLQNCFNYCESLTQVSFPLSLPNLTNGYGIFGYCDSIQYVKLPNMKNVQILDYCFVECFKLLSVSFPDTLNELTDMEGIFWKCYKLEIVHMPKSMNKLQNMYASFENCYLLNNITIPYNTTTLIDLERCYTSCSTMTYIKLPSVANSLTGLTISNCTELDTLILPTSATSIVVINAFNTFNIDTISTCTFGTGMASIAFYIKDLKTFKQPTLRVSKLVLIGNSLATASQLHTINIDWANSTYGGTTPQIDIRYNSLSATTIDAIFTALPVVVGKTINVAGNIGSATCTPSIASLKGWTVIVL